MSDLPRAVWLTEADLMDECDNLRSICRAQWRVAPEAEAAATAAVCEVYGVPIIGDYAIVVSRVLAALKMPPGVPT